MRIFPGKLFSLIEKKQAYITDNGEVVGIAADGVHVTLGYAPDIKDKDPISKQCFQQLEKYLEANSTPKSW